MMTIEQRIKRLEDAVFGGAGMKQKSKGQATSYSGPTGGVRFVASKGFFKTKRDLGTVREELVKHEYHYSAQAVHEALKRLSGKNGPLVVITEGSKKLYVNRK